MNHPYTPRRRHLIGVVLFYALLVLLSYVLLGCATPRNAEKYYRKHPGAFAKDCATAFPVQESSDSAAYNRSMRELDSLLKDFASDAKPQLGDSDLPPATGRLDVYKPGGKTTASAYEKQLAQIKQAVANLKPVVVRVKDSAGLAALHQHIQILGKEIAGKEAAYNKLQGRTELMGNWLMWVVVALLALLVIAVVYVVLKIKKVMPV